MNRACDLYHNWEDYHKYGKPLENKFAEVHLMKENAMAYELVLNMRAALAILEPINKTLQKK